MTTGIPVSVVSTGTVDIRSEHVQSNGRPLMWWYPSVTPFVAAHDLFGDDNLLLLPTPGHTPGSLPLLVRNAGSRSLLMVGDLTYDIRFVQHEHVPGVGRHRQLLESTRKINALREQHAVTVVLPAHDPGAVGRLAATDYPVSFIVTNTPANDLSGDGIGTGEPITEVEARFRRRSDIEDRIRQAKLGAAPRHLPPGTTRSTRVKVGGAARREPLDPLQTPPGIDEGGRAHAARLRNELLCVPARLVRHGRRPTLRLPLVTTCFSPC